MFHDPCNPLPSSIIPSGLSPPPHHVAMPHPGALTPALPQSHAITAMPPTYLGCDHNQVRHQPIKSVQMPPAVDLPAVLVPHASAIIVGTLPSVSPELQSFAVLPIDEVQMQMPEPASIIMFLFAIIVVWCARRLEVPRWTLPPLFTVQFVPPAQRHRRHRSKSIACYQAFQH